MLTNRLTRAPLKLSDYEGRIVLLDFFAWWCGPCNVASPDVETNLNRSYQAKGGNQFGVPVTVISVNIESDSPERTDAFVKSYGLELVADDLENVAYSQFDLGGIPLFVVINGATNSPNAQPWEVLYRQAGYSRSDITNAIEKVKVSATPVAPTFNRQPASRAILPGGTVNFTARAAGLPTPSYQWLFNHAPLAGQTNATLSLTQITTDDQGGYQAWVYNSAGAAASQVAQLTVITNLTAPGVLDTRFTLVNGSPDWDANDLVVKLVVQPDGKVLVGGGFSRHFDGPLRTCLARLNPNGVLDTDFNSGSGLNGMVDAIALQSDGRIIIGGWFNSFNGTNRNSLARLNPDGRLDLAFNPNPQGRGVQSLLVQLDGKIVVAGGFTNIAGAARAGLARLAPEGTLDATFNAGTGPNNAILCLALQADGKILAGGYFTSFAGAPRKGVARLLPNGTLDPAFNVYLDYVSRIETIVVQPDGKILLGGWFYQQVNNNYRYHITRFNPNGSLDLSFNPGAGADDYVEAILLQPDGKLVVGGDFGSFNAKACEHLVRLNANGSPDTFFAAWLQIRHLLASDRPESVIALALQPNGEILVGGRFGEINGYRRPGFARLHGDAAGRPLLFSPQWQTPGIMSFALAAQPGKTYLLQTSLDLTAWNDWLTTPCTNSVMTLIDDRPQSPRLYYRALEKP